MSSSLILASSPVIQAAAVMSSFAFCSLVYMCVYNVLSPETLLQPCEPSGAIGKAATLSLSRRLAASFLAFSHDFAPLPAVLYALVIPPGVAPIEAPPNNNG